jgi:hypothetical protein
VTARWNEERGRRELGPGTSSLDALAARLQHIEVPTPSHRRSFAALATAALLAIACRDGTAPAPPLLAVVGGEGQRAIVDMELPGSIVVELRDASQRPLAGVGVKWAAAVGAADVITPEARSTDGAGRVRARWQLDDSQGTHTIFVSSVGGARTQVNAWADPRPSTNVHPLPMITYEGSGQIVHPDFVRLPVPWSGDPLRLAATPYPSGRAYHENPSLYSGSTETIWNVPSGVVNPLVHSDAGYLSDPDMVYDPDAPELRLYYRRVTNENEIWLIRSTDGVLWSAPVLVVHAPNHVIISPSIVRRGPGEWLMWSVNGGAMGCEGPSTSVELRRSADGVSWSDPEQVTLDDPDGFAWHIEVEWIPSRSEYWALYPAKRPGTCTTDRLRFATSADGLRWQSYPSAVLNRGASAELADIVYRSSFDYDDASGIVTLWYSGARADHGVYAWHMAWERLSETALLARVSAIPTAAALRPLVSPTPNAPQLTNRTAP